MSEAAPNPDHQLMDLLYRVPKQLYAVVDGAHFDNLPAELRERQLSSRPLYLEGKTPDGVLAGPHLTPLYDMEAVSRLLTIVAGKPAAVFWSWPGDIDALQRHLRSINMVEIPAPDSTEGVQPVLLRHADPNVMASILPLLRPEQAARLFGMSERIVFFASDPDNGAIGLHHLAPPTTFAAHGSGFLRIDPDQYDALTLGRRSALERRTYAYLVRNGGMFLAGREPKVLAGETSRWLAEGKAMGIVGERALWKYCFIQLSTNGKAGQDKSLKDWFGAATRSDPPDSRVDRLMTDTINRLQGL